MAKITSALSALARSTFRKYRNLSFVGKIAVWVVILFYIALATVVLVLGPKTISQSLYDLSQRLRNYRFGWLILGSIVLVTSFPPLIGHGTFTSLCGFAYGLKGIFIAAPANFLGSVLTFVTLRFLFKKRIRSWASRNEKWQALESVVKAKGLPLIILIRVSPFPPMVYNNALFASIEPVALWQFMVATICMLPKLFVFIFISSRIAAFSDGKQRNEMDTLAKVINGLSIGIGILIMIGTGGLLYRLMNKHIQELRESPDLVDELAADALEEAEEGAPLLRDFSSESVNVIHS